MLNSVLRDGKLYGFIQLSINWNKTIGTVGAPVAPNVELYTFSKCLLSVAGKQTQKRRKYKEGAYSPLQGNVGKSYDLSGTYFIFLDLDQLWSLQHQLLINLKMWMFSVASAVRKQNVWTWQHAFQLMVSMLKMK